jgi:hypothetical protein
MSEITFVAADFNVIRRNQFKLVQQGLIEDEEETDIKQPGTVSIEVKNTETTINLEDIWTNDYFNKKNQKDLKLTFVKSLVGANYMAILGVLGTKGNTVKIYDGKKLLGSFKSVLSIPEKTTSLSFINQMNKFKQVDSKTEFPLYTFIKKL